LLPRYYVFAAPLLGVAAVVSVLLLTERYPSAKLIGLLALLGTGAFYIGKGTGTRRLVCLFGFASWFSNRRDRDPVRHT
jgi:hypothetical protein